MELVFIVGFAILIFVSILVTSEDKNYWIFIPIFALLLAWPITATSIKKPVITHHKIHTITENGNQTQVIFIGESPLNITRQTGKIFHEGTIIERTSTIEGTWSLGIFCVFGTVKYKSLETTVETK
jgi:hypothetical protein